MPSGVSYTRLFADLNESGASTGTRRIDLKGVFQGHTRVARFVVTLVPDFTYIPGVDGASNGQTAVLVLMHVVAASVIVGMLTRLVRPAER